MQILISLRVFGREILYSSIADKKCCDVYFSMVSVKGQFKLEPHPHWSSLGVQSKFSDEHTRHFSMGVPPKGWGVHADTIISTVTFCSLKNLFCMIKLSTRLLKEKF